ncbi:type II secretion system F family protein [Terrabacter terrigena]|uniref:Type II secretion system F family protein n=1 Tax=Terrabacter terrigena TaxID=574718 RepID=A0ABW3MWJ4_9MICO
MFRRLVPAAVTAGLAAIVVVVGSMPASAADSVTVGLSGVSTTTSSSASLLTGVLTLRSRSAVQVDAGRLTVRVDGVDHKPTVKQAPKRARKAMLVIDTSGSMGVSGMATVRAASKTFLATVPSDVLVGVTSFADTAGVDLAPTLDRKAVQRVVDGLASRGNTSLYAAMSAATTSLGATGDRSILLLSDGADTVARNGPATLSTTVDKLRSAGVRVDVVRFKTSDPDAVTALSGFASANGGSVVPAADTAAVASAFQTAAKALDQQVQFSLSLPGVKAGDHQVEVAGVAGGTSFAFTRKVRFDAPVPAAAPSTVPAPQASAQAIAGGSVVDSLATLTKPNYVPWIAAGLLGLAVLTFVMVVSAPTLQTRRERRVAAIEGYVVGSRSAAREEARAAQHNITESLLDLGEKVMKDRESTKTTMSLIERADLPFRAGEWFVVRVIAVVLGVVGGWLFGAESPMIPLGAGALVGLVLPPVALRFMAARRSKHFERQLPDILMLVSTSLKSGFGLPQALDAVARDTAEPAAKEFSRALAETRIGTDITDALERMGERMGSVSMRWAVMSIRIQRDVGGNLADTLRTTANTLRERESLQRQVATLSAEGKLSAYILVAMPIFLFFYMMRVNYDYVSLLWTDQIGVFMGIGGIVSLFVGMLWMRSVVKIEV